MEFTTFGVDDGYVEAMARGFRSSFLTEDIYTNLRNAKDITEFKLVSEAFKRKKILSPSPKIPPFSNFPSLELKGLGRY